MKENKGGVFATSDFNIIKDALDHYAKEELPDVKLRQIANLLHRLNNRT